MRVIATWLATGKTIAGSLEWFENYTKISRKRILNCIETGKKWKGWTFDEGLDDDEGEGRSDSKETR